LRAAKPRRRQERGVHPRRLITLLGGFAAWRLTIQLVIAERAVVVVVGGVTQNV
jgi:hypothetical protein